MPSPRRDPNSWSPSPVRCSLRSEVRKVPLAEKELERRSFRESRDESEPGRASSSRSPTPEERCRRKVRTSRSRSPRDRSWARSPSTKRGRRVSPSPQTRRESPRDRPEKDWKREERSDQDSESYSRERRQRDRDNPAPNRNLGVFGLRYKVTHNDLFQIFRDFGRIENAKVVTDPAGESRGFGFVKFERLEDAELARREMNGVYIYGKRIRVDYSTSDGPHRPTPGRYLGSDHKPRYGYRCRSFSPSPNGMTYRYR